MNYYTYAYLREDKTPYYIGKGKGKRIYEKRKGEVRPPKEKSRVIFLKQNLTEEESFKHEIYMIAIFGRKDLGTGILRNKTNGGDGVSGMILSSESKEKIRQSKIGKISPFFGKTHSYEAKEKLRNFRINMTLSEKTKEKLSGENNPSSKWWKLTFSDGRELVLCGIHNWSKKNGYDRSLISKVYMGIRKRHKDIIKVEEINN